MNFTIEQLGPAILFLIALVISVTVHEFGHAWAATKLGDPLPKAQGRLTLSPTAHADLVGTIIFPLIMALTSIPLLGWGRPVLTNPTSYTRKISRATGSMLVAVAGPGMNFVLALIVSLLCFVGVKTGLLQPDLLVLVINHLVVLNITLMIFNLLPIPPLDGGAVLAWVLPRSLQFVIDFLNRWGFLILLALVMTPMLSFVTKPGQVVARWWVHLLLGAVGS